MRHVVVTRINFDDDDLFHQYFTVMKQTYIPSIKSQTNKNFEIYFIINKKHIPHLQEFFSDNVRYFNSFQEVKDYCYSNNIEIQTRHDCDDWMRDDYINKIQELCLEQGKIHDKLIIHSKVEKLNINTGEIYRHGLDYSRGTYTSMFLTLFQKKVDNFVYDKNHRYMNEITKNIYLLEGGYTRLVIHGNNLLSKINESDTKIQPNSDVDLSVIIPTYDNTEYLDECFESIFKSVRNYKIEVLVGIDNCIKSKQFVVDNFEKYQNKINFFFFDKNVGPYVIRNSLAKISNSNRLLFIDSDDLVHKNLFTRVITELETKQIVRFKFYNFKLKNELEIYNVNNVNPFISIGQLGIQKDALMKLNGFEPWVCSADSEFKMREEGNNFRVSNINEVLYYRRRHDKNLTKKKETNHSSGLRQNYDRIIAKRRLEKKYGKLVELPLYKFYKLEKNGELNLINDYVNLNMFHHMDMGKPELTIIIPTYNIPNYLNECLISVIQSCGNINCEVLVGIDKCENTLNYIKSKDFDPRIRFFYFENNVGPYVIKNSLSKISRSDSILFFDSDDIMKDTMVSDIINKQNNFEFVKPMYSNFNNIISNIKVNEVKTGQYGEGVFSIKKDLFLHMNGFEGWRCAADSDFMKRLYKNNRKFSYTDEVLFYRRKHSSNLTTAPETGFMSKLRAGYASITKNKKDFGPLPNIITENFTEIYPNNYTLIGDYGTSFINDTIDREKSEVISRLTLKRQTLKPIIQEVRESVPEKKEYITVDNTGVINTIFTRKSNPEVSQQPIQVQTNNRQPVRNSQVQKDIINEKRKLLSQSQQKVTPDGFKQKKTYNKGDMTRRGGSFNF
jgi:glycosyltransferase involved in cell wall biosynthesis